METIFITGGNGYIGRRFLRNILQENIFKIYSVVRTKNDDLDNLTEIISDISNIANYKKQLLDSDFIVWFAALRAHFASDDDLYFNNVLPIENIIPILNKSKKLKKFIFISSISVLSDNIGRIIPISNLNTPSPITPYGKSKLKAEQLIQSSNLPYLILRLPFMYGSGYKRFTHLWSWEKLSNFYTISFRFPTASISLLHIDDLSKILLMIIKENFKINPQTTLLIADPKEYQIDQILAFLASNKNCGSVTNRLNCSSFLKSIFPLILNKKN